MQNLGFLTDFKLLGTDSEVTEYPDYFLTKTLSNPTFIDGNCLILKSPELLKDKVHLEQQFKAHFDLETSEHHIGLKLMEKPSDDLLNVYLQDEYEYDKLVVMTYQKKKERQQIKVDPVWTIRQFEIEGDWGQWIENEIKERPAIFSEASFTNYLLNRKVVYQELVQQGKGNFYGVFQNGELLASAGLYIFDGIGRFQQVRTIEKARKKGMCKALIDYIHTRNATKMTEAVIVADEDYHALKIYEGLGFQCRENQYSLTKVLRH